MTQKIKNTTTDDFEQAVAEVKVMASSQMGQDLKSAVLVVSVMANLFVFTLWIALQVTSQYDAQIASVLFRH